MIMIVVLIVGVCACAKPSGKPDKNDSENYIGAADIDPKLAKMFDITSEDMAIMKDNISEDTIRQMKKLKIYGLVTP